MSTIEAEYRALADCTKEAIHLRWLLLEPHLYNLVISLNFSVPKLLNDMDISSTPTELDLHLYCDKTSAIKLAQNLVFHAHSKQIELHHHFVREKILQCKVTVSYL